MPKVSIIMGIYNCSRCLPQAIDSILEQTFTDWELVLCDDGSKDNTYEVAKRYAEKYKGKIVLLKNEKNIRLAATLNKCLSVAKGMYIARMDADDKCKPERLEKEVEYLDKHKDVDCVGCGMIIFDENGERGIRLNIEHPTKDFLIHTTPFAHPTIMMRKKTYDDLGGYAASEKSLRCDDTDLWFRFYAAGYKGYNLQEPLYYYHESVSDFKKRTLKSALETFGVCIKGYKMLDYPLWKYIYAFKPVLSALVPNWIMFHYHNLLDNRQSKYKIKQ